MVKRKDVPIFRVNMAILKYSSKSLGHSHCPVIWTGGVLSPVISLYGIGKCSYSR